MEVKEFTIRGLDSKSATILVDCPEQLTSLEKGDRISIAGLVKLVTRSKTKPSLPDEFVIKNNGEGIIETLKESIEGYLMRSIYEVSGNVIRNFNLTEYKGIKSLVKYYEAMWDFKKRA